MALCSGKGAKENLIFERFFLEILFLVVPLFSFETFDLEIYKKSENIIP